LIGLSYLWGGKVSLETTEFAIEGGNNIAAFRDPEDAVEYKKLRVLYTCQNKDLRKSVLRREE